MIRFLLNQDLRVEQDLDPNMTVLNYLRYHVGKTGTKEGCASGDCGACTVVIGELDGDQVRYKSVNSCLTFVTALDGKQLITVEDLKEGEQLHPAQQAMVDCHGSQCGFCTPGFVMSMFALGKNIAQPEKEDIQEALAGNLCRCTGYRPIVDATNAMYEHGSDDKFSREQSETAAKLKEIQITTSEGLAGAGRNSFNPKSVAELAEIYAQNPQAKLLAGGTDLALEVTQFHRDIDTLIYVGDVADMKQVIVHDDHIELGGAATLTSCYKALSADYPDFGQLLHRFASLQIRNQGTLGGNIGNASPIGDSPPALISLNAKLVLRKGDQQRTIALEDFFLDYKVTDRQEGEFIEKVLVPRAKDNGEYRVYKISKRIDDDISAVLAAINMKIEDGVVTYANLAFGGMAAVPKRAAHCEAALLGKPWNEETVEAAKAALAQDFQPISDMRASKEYRTLSAQNLLMRFFYETEAPEVETRVTAYV